MITTEEDKQVKEHEIIEWANINRYFFTKINSETNKGLIEAFEYAPHNFIRDKCNDTQSVIFKHLKQLTEYNQKKIDD